jgi:hypothetical protein
VSAAGSQCAAMSAAAGCRLYLSDENTGQAYLPRGSQKYACPEPFCYTYSAQNARELIFITRERIIAHESLYS